MLIQPQLTKDINLERKTLAFWVVSRAYNGTSREEIPYNNAMKRLRRIQSKTNPSRPLGHQVTNLAAALILEEAPIKYEGKILNLRKS